MNRRQPIIVSIEMGKVNVIANTKSGNALRLCRLVVVMVDGGLVNGRLD